MILTLALAAEPTLLLCDDVEQCEAERAWAQQVSPPGREIAPVDLLLLLDAGGWSGGSDQRDRLQKALYDGDAALDKARWGDLEAAVADGRAALAAWPGTVSSGDLFRLWFLQGCVDVARRRDPAYAFRQATAMSGTVVERLPTDDPRFTRPYLDEARKLLVGGKGTLQITADDGVSVWVDGERIDGKTAMFPGYHRVTATRPGSIRTWQADVPVLAERTSRVQPTFTQEGDAAWVRAQLGGALDTLAAPPEVTQLLVGWCARYGIAELELMQVRVVYSDYALPELALSDRPLERPLAAEGEAVDMGDGVPSTFGEAVLQARADSERAPSETRRIKTVYFDPKSEQFRSDTGLPEVVDVPQEHFRLGARTGYARVLGHHHLGVEASLMSTFGRWGAGVGLGVYRSDAPYRLQAGWVDKQLYRVGLEGRFALLPGRYTPVLSVGPEVWAPVAVGGRVGVGLDARFAPLWVASVRAEGTVLYSKVEVPLGWGASLGVARAY